MKKLIQHKIENIILEKPTHKLRYIKHPVAYWYQRNLDKKCHERILRLTRGIYVMEEWWREQDVKVTYPIIHRNEYSLYGLKKLEKYIRQFHAELAPHINLETKELIFGIGATQIIHAVMYALCIEHGQKISHNHKSLLIPPLYLHIKPLDILG